MIKILGLMLTALIVSSSSAAPVCPNTFFTNTDCGYILTIGAGGIITGAAVAGANPYDGADDEIVGVVNNSGAAFSGTVMLTGVGNGGGIFDFDSDGICTYVSAPYCTSAATGYEGPLVTFRNIHNSSTFADTGTVIITDLAAGATTYFSLEGSPSSINNGMGPTVSPEPASLALLGTGLGVLLYFARKSRGRISRA